MTVRQPSHFYHRVDLKQSTLFLIICLSLINGPFVSAQTKQTTSSISIDASRPTSNISPLLYGQFIEHMFEGVKFGLHAELLRNRSFEEQPNVIGLPRYWERYPDDRNDDYSLQFGWDSTISYPDHREVKTETADHSLRVEAGTGVIHRHGIFQSRITLRKGIDYAGSLWIKTGDYSGAIVLALEEDRQPGVIYAQSSITPIQGSWNKYEFRLRAPVTDSLARFAIIFQGRGHLWLDQISLIPGDAIDGVRRDVLTKVRALKPAFLRWPGGNVAQDYHWQWAIGPRDARVSWTNPSWKNELEPGDFGTAEFVQFSHNVGAQPAITVNVEGRGATVEEAASWVEYCNGPTSTRFGALRAAHGHSQPFNIRLWEIGNEIWGSWVRGHSDAETYARNFRRYAQAMRKVDPAIKLIAVGDNNMNWNRTVVSRAGADIDYLAIHHYYGRREMAGDQSNLMARPLVYQKFYEQVAQLLNELSPQHPIQLAINEWGLDLPLEQQYSMLSALYGARLMNVFERSNGLVAMSAVSDLVNGWPGGIIQSGRDGLFVSPIYLVNQLYSEKLGTELLSTKVDSPTFDSSREGKAVAYLDAVASRSADGKMIFIKVVNSNLDNAISTTVSIKGVRIRPQVEIATINSARLSDANGFQSPDAIQIKRSFLSGGLPPVLTLPPHSVSVLTLTTLLAR